MPAPAGEITASYYDDYKVEIVTGTIGWTVPAGVTSVDYLVIGGGGGGGGLLAAVRTGFGQAGVVKEGTLTVVPEDVYELTQGDGGVSGAAVWNDDWGWLWLNGVAGSQSSIGSLVVAAGGLPATSSGDYTAAQRAGKSGTFWNKVLSDVGGGGVAPGAGETKYGTNGIVAIRYKFLLRLTTDNVTDVLVTEFVANGSIDNGDATRRGFCYYEGMSGNPTIYDSIVEETGSYTAEAFSLTIDTLTSNSNYRVRAFAENSVGVVYGETIQACTDADDGVDGTVTATELAYFELTNAEFRGGIVADDELYVALGDRVLYITKTGAVGYVGQLSTTTGYVSMAFNGAQILIVDGTVYGKYVTKSSKAWNSISHVDFPAASSCTFIDGYFVVTKVGTGEFYLSAIYDAATWNALDYATAEGRPDDLHRCLNANNSLWLMGSGTTEVWYNTGDVNFPFARIQGAVIEDGVVGPTAATIIKDQIYFLSDKLEIVRTVGYQRQKISTLHIDTAIQTYSKVDDAITFSYAMDGHTFFVITFPTVDKTWVFDTTTNAWHEWESYKTQGLATYGRHRGSDCFYLNNAYYICDHTNGNIYEIDPLTYNDGGEPIRRIRRTQFISKDKKNITHHEINLEFELIDAIEYGTAPSVGLRYSDDNTNSWSVYRYNNFATVNTPKARQIWRRLGISRTRIYEVFTNANCKFVLMGASAVLEDFKE